MDSQDNINKSNGFIISESSFDGMRDFYSENIVVDFKFDVLLMLRM